MYTYSYKRRLHWSECDPAGIIFFAVYGRWISEGLNEMLLQNGIDPNAVNGGVQTGLPAVSLTQTFHSAPKLHEEVTHQIHVEKLGGKSLRFHHEFRNSQHALLMDAHDVRVWTTHTIGNPESLKSAEIPAHIRALLESSHRAVPSA